MSVLWTCVVVLALAALASGQPKKVAVRKTEKGHELTVNGKPVFVKGAVGWQELELLKDSGGNALRCGPNMLDECEKYGLMALVGLPLGNPRHGFDYSDQAKVEEQRRRALEIVRKFKDHPAVLVWNIGNEPEIHTTPEQRRAVWEYVESLAKEIKSVDPNHPVICVSGSEYREMLHEVPAQCPSLDAVGLNSYADMLKLPDDVRKQGYSGAYLVTEFGPRGHWQVEKTPWGMPIEDTSAEKAAFYKRSYEAAVAGQPNCLGSFTFLWAQKQEKTHTWYGMFLPDGSPIETVGAMQEVWGIDKGSWPSVGPNGIHQPGGERLRWAEAKAGEVVEFEIDAIGGEADWDLRKDVGDNPNVGGDHEPDTPVIAAFLGKRVKVQMPPTPGFYRLFAYLRNDRQRVATANLPILVK